MLIYCQYLCLNIASAGWLSYNNAMPNKVFINKENTIEFNVIGDQTVETIHEMTAIAVELIKELEKQGRPILILDDLTEMGHTDTAARKAVADAAKVLKYDKIAMFSNAGMFMRYGTNLMIQAIGKGEQIKYFESREEAMDWLLSGL